MVRRLILGVVVGVVLLGGTAAGQNSPPTVLPVTIVAPTTSETVLPTTIVQPTTTVIVKGIVIERPLPRTGNDFGIQVIVGSALTAAGLAFAITARIRRQRVNAPASS